MIETQISYLAGIIDGEGCFHIRKNKCYQKHKGGICKCSPRYCCALTIVNTNKDLIDKLNETWGGFISTLPEKGNRRLSHRIVFSSRDTERIAQLVLPYLIVKKRQANLILKFRESFKTFSRKVTKKVTEERQINFEVMHKFNQRGLVN